jgi:hypothetical protein
MPHVAITTYRRIPLLAVAVMIVGCTVGTDEAKQGVAEFRTRVAQRSFVELHRAAAPEFRGAATEEQFAHFMTALDRKLGTWQSGGEPVWNVTRGTGGHFVVLTYQSRFARGAATERFTWRIEGGAPVLMGYNVNSPLLVTE